MISDPDPGRRFGMVVGVGETENGIEIESGLEKKIGMIVGMEDGMTRIVTGRETESGIETEIGTLTKSETETETETENGKEMDGGGRSLTPYLPFPHLPPVPFFLTGFYEKMKEHIHTTNIYERSAIWSMNIS